MPYVVSYEYTVSDEVFVPGLLQDQIVQEMEDENDFSTLKEGGITNEDIAEYVVLKSQGGDYQDFVTKPYVEIDQNNAWYFKGGVRE
jgi:hypothetical protein